MTSEATRIPRPSVASRLAGGGTVVTLVVVLGALLVVFGLNCLVYCYMGFIAGLASLVQAQLAQSVTPTVLVGKELDVLAAVVLGGASLMGGVGSVFGTILGVALLAILQNGLVLMGVSSYWSQLFVGLVILVSVSTTAWSQRRRRAGIIAQ